jgi:hypothetical protein
LATAIAAATAAGATAPRSPGSDDATSPYRCRAGFQGSWEHNEFPEGRIFRIGLAGRDRIRWNGVPISRDRLRRRLDAVGAARGPNFTLLVFTDETDCALVQDVRAEMTRRLQCGEGRCGEHYTSADPPPRQSAAETERLRAQAQADMDFAVRQATEAADAALAAAQAAAGKEKPEF